jgi:hypothetical protein
MKYNCNIIVNYNTLDNDDIYREQFLRVFNLTEYNDDVIKKAIKEIETLFYNNINIETLYFNMKKTQRFIIYQDSDLLIYLFSYDLFYLTHNLIKSIINKNEEDINNKLHLLINTIENL